MFDVIGLYLIVVAVPLLVLAYVWIDGSDYDNGRRS